MDFRFRGDSFLTCWWKMQCSRYLPEHRVSGLILSGPWHRWALITLHLCAGSGSICCLLRAAHPASRSAPLTQSHLGSGALKLPAWTVNYMTHHLLTISRCIIVHIFLFFIICWSSLHLNPFFTSFPLHVVTDPFIRVQMGWTLRD